MTSQNAISGYASAIYSVAAAEGELDAVKSQLGDVSEAVNQNEQLRSALSDRLLPAATRGQIVDDVLGGKTSDTTKALVGMIVTAGKGSQLPAIVGEFLNRAATGSGQKLATVRSAVALTEDQKQRLTKALSTNAGTEVQIRNVVDPDVVGGIVTEMGDTVIDGSVRSKLDEMKDAL